MIEKHYIVTHYADGKPSETRELSDEEYTEIINGGSRDNVEPVLDESTDSLNVDG